MNHGSCPMMYMQKTMLKSLFMIIVRWFEMLYNIIVLQLFLQLKVSQLKTMPNYNKSYTIKCPRHYCNFGRPQIRGCVGTNQIAATMINLVGEFLSQIMYAFTVARFSCHKWNWNVDTDIKLVKLIKFCNPWPQLFPVSCHSLQIFPCSFEQKMPHFLITHCTFAGIAPMPPLGPGVRRDSNPRPGFSPYESHNIQTINTNGEFVWVIS